VRDGEHNYNFLMATERGRGVIFWTERHPSQREVQ
jgi:hypothetical protein